MKTDARQATATATIFTVARAYELYSMMRKLIK